MPLAPRGFTLGFITGFGAGFVTRSLADNPREKMAPFVKATMRAGVHLMERTREVTAHIGELLQDTLAEVTSELRKAAHGKSAAAKAPRRKQAAKPKRRREHAPTHHPRTGTVIDLNEARRE